MKTAKETESCMKQLTAHGQSIWLDFIRRSFVEKGDLKELVDAGLRGVTSNPSIFEKAITGSDDYSEQLAELFQKRSLGTNAIYESLAIKDVKEACDILRPVYEETKGRDGYVSMEVSPLLAADTEATINEARRLWKAVDRPNLMIKVPGTEQGAPAIETLISEGMNVNVTLLFSCDAYIRAAEAYMKGLEARRERGEPLDTVASVASFFVSRIDSLVDSLLKKIIEKGDDEKKAERARKLLGKAAIANAKLAYEIYRDLYTSERWKSLVSGGARPQRLLWASTSTKDPSYPDTLYIDELIGNETVNTVPVGTLEDFMDHGTVADTLETKIDESREVIEGLERLGISFNAVTDQLLEEGVEKFAASFRHLLAGIKSKKRASAPPLHDSLVYNLPDEISRLVKETVSEWTEAGKTEKLFNKDKSLWTGDNEQEWMGWLDIVERQLDDLARFERFSRDVADTGFTHVLLLGMGGSSLCPEVMSMTFGKQNGYPVLEILDSTNPAQVRARRSAIDPAKTLFIVASKSGSTLEPNIFMGYFLDEVSKVVGKEKAGQHFVAITDPGSKLEQLARENGFRHVFHGVPSIGGRYSALSDFGMIPSAAMGVDVERLLENAEDMVAATSSKTVLENPGVLLGIIIGACHAQGRDKLTVVTSPSISDLGAWLEQLLAESTGKQGKAIIPVDRELLAAPAAYGSDRLFVYLVLEEQRDEGIEDALAALAKSGHPVVCITLGDRYQIAQEFFRWEVATAVAGSIMGINPFNQPDVESSKVATRSLIAEFEKKQAQVLSQSPFFEEGGIKLFADAKNVEELTDLVGEKRTLESFLCAHLGRLVSGRDYLALLAYLNMNEENERLLQNLRHALRDSHKVATCLGFGPRYLHSTGQAYKGGPNSGVVLQLTGDHAVDVDVPGHSYSFGVVSDAQALGDLQVLSERSRRLLRVHLTGEAAAGLKKLQEIVSRACSA